MKRFYINCGIILTSVIVIACVFAKRNSVSANNITPMGDTIQVHNVDTNLEIEDIIININTGYSLSDDGKEFIKQHEKCVLKPYKDGKYYSVGWGHNGPDVDPDMVITQHKADEYFEDDIKWVEERANAMINDLPYEYEFSQGFVDGLCSLIYNAGAGGIRKSEFYKRLTRCRVVDGEMNMEDYYYTLAAVKTTRISHPGHHKRRKAEHYMMLN